VPARHPQRHPDGLNPETACTGPACARNAAEGASCLAKVGWSRLSLQGMSGGHAGCVEGEDVAARARQRELVRRGYDAISLAYRGDGGAAAPSSAEDVSRYPGGSRN
jgi:hypothetical protein